MVSDFLVKDQQRELLVEQAWIIAKSMPAWVEPEMPASNRYYLAQKRVENTFEMLRILEAQRDIASLKEYLMDRPPVRHLCELIEESHTQFTKIARILNKK